MSSGETRRSQPVDQEVFATPKTLYDVRLGYSVQVPDAVLATHVDSIQAILLVLMDNADANVLIKGRSTDEPGQILRIARSSLYNHMIGMRANGRKQLFDIASEVSGEDFTSIGIMVEDTEAEPFPCQFYSGNDIVSDWLDGKTTPNHLMPVFGGVTVLTIGSDTAGKDQLETVGQKIASEVYRRQIAGVPLLGLDQPNQ